MLLGQIGAKWHLDLDNAIFHTGQFGANCAHGVLPRKTRRHPFSEILIGPFIHAAHPFAGAKVPSSRSNSKLFLKRPDSDRIELPDCAIQQAGK